MTIPYELALLVFFLELGLLFFLLVLIFIHRTLSNRSIIYVKRRRKAIAKFCLTRLNQKQASLGKFSHADLLTVLESFNSRLNSADWILLKKELCLKHLLPKARRYAKSPFWTKRNFAAKIFVLVPLLEDETLICHLIDDPKFLVQGNAALAATLLESSKGIYKILEHMSHNTGYAYYFFRDILSEGSQKTLSLVASWIPEKKDTPFHLSCLNVLTLKTSSANICFLTQDLLSPNPNIRLAALKVLKRNPFEKLSLILLKSLADPDETIRLEAILGLLHFKNPKTLSHLNKHLSDPSWKVRLGAATTLKQLGTDGIKLLYQQSPNTHLFAYEAAQYALQLS